jgi:hypothetical protein
MASPIDYITFLKSRRQGNALLRLHSMTEDCRLDNTTPSGFKTKKNDPIHFFLKYRFDRYSTNSNTTYISQNALPGNSCLDTITAMMKRQHLGLTWKSKAVSMIQPIGCGLRTNFWTYEDTSAFCLTLLEKKSGPKLFQENAIGGRGTDRFGPTADLIAKIRDRTNNLFSSVIAVDVSDPKNILVYNRGHDLLVN